MSTKGNYLSWIVVSNIDEARKFFAEVLGLKENAYAPEFKWAEFQGKNGGGLIGIGEYDKQSDIPAGSNAVLTFSVDDIVIAKKELMEKGAKMLGEIIEIPGHVKMQSFSDKDGNYFQIVESTEEKI